LIGRYLNNDNDTWPLYIPLMLIIILLLRGMTLNLDAISQL